MTTAIEHVHGLAIYNATIGIVNSNLTAILLLLALYVEHVAQGKLVNLIILTQLEAGFNLGLHLLGEEHLINQLALDELLGRSECQQTIVNQLVELVGLNLTALGHLLEPVFPDTTQVSLALLAIVIAHASKGVALYIALIFSNLGHLELDAKLIVQSLIILALTTQTAQIDRALTIKVDLIGNGSYIIRGL